MSAKQNKIAVIGIGCLFPGAKTKEEFWENVLARRQQFRAQLDCRLPNSQYFNADPKAEDMNYGKYAAYIEGFEFDWAKRLIPKAITESTDIVHWLALEAALAAFADAGIDRKQLSESNTRCLVGNSLTGEQSRAFGYRMRWPYVLRSLQTSAKLAGIPDAEVEKLAGVMKKVFKSTLPPVNEDTLAGALSNTIAGRICNYLNLKAGGYVVDGACSSSLIAVATGSEALVNGEADMVIAGGVDVSLDTFELIGFSKTGALTPDTMHVYDKRAKGFVPGEGAGFVVLKRYDDAVRDGNKIYAAVRGWGVSSDGKGGLTAPDKKGQSNALQRAYRMAGYNPGDIRFVEGHGTGTPVGDKAELEGVALTIDALGGARGKAVAMTSLKSIMGHMKAAAGIGAFIKTVMSVNRRFVPAIAGCREPNPIFSTAAKHLYPTIHGEEVAGLEPVRAGVSAMGFGGINCHVTIESVPNAKPAVEIAMPERKLSASYEDAEVFAFSGASPAELSRKIEAALVEARAMSFAELADFAKHLSQEARASGAYRATVVAENPTDLSAKLEHALEKLLHFRDGTYVNGDRSVWLSQASGAQRVGFLFPGQGSQYLGMARLLVERFDWARERFETACKILREKHGLDLATLMHRSFYKANTAEELSQWETDLTSTNVAQPAICLASALWFEYLGKMGIRPEAVIGHSLGELTAFYAAGAITFEELIEISALRGQLMSAEGGKAGTMASLSCDRATAEAILSEAKGYVTIANLNGPKQTVISGEPEAVAHCLKIAADRNVVGQQLKVSNAFHSIIVDEAAQKIRTYFYGIRATRELQCKLVSCMEGKPMPKSVDLKDYLGKQIVSRVDFVTAVTNLSDSCDLLVEVGPGSILSNLSQAVLELKPDRQAFPVEKRTSISKELKTALAGLFSAGIEIDWSQVYAERFVKPFRPFAEKKFIVNPFEKPFIVPELGLTADNQPLAAAPKAAPVASVSPNVVPFAAKKKDGASDLLATVIGIVAEKSGLPKDMISPEMKLSDDLMIDVSVTREILDVIGAEVGQNASNLDASRLRHSTIEGLVAAYAGGANVVATTGTYARAAGSDIGPSPFAKRSVAATEPVPARVEAPAPAPAPAKGGNSKVKEHVFRLVSEKTGFATDMIQPEMKVIEDLNLDSIKAGEIVAALSAEFGTPENTDLGAIANGTLQELIEAFSKGLPADEAPASAQHLPVQPVPMAAPAPAQASAGDPKVSAFVFKLIEEKTGFSTEMITPSMTLIDDLHLDSIKAGEIIAALSAEFGTPEGVDMGQLSTGTVEQLVSAFGGSQASPAPAPAPVTAAPAPVAAPAPAPSAPASAKSGPVRDLVYKLVEEKTGFSGEMITPTMTLIDDLHLDSIKAGEIIAALSAEFGTPEGVDMGQLSTGSLQGLIDAFSGGAPAPAPSFQPVAAAPAPKQVSAPVAVPVAVAPAPAPAAEPEPQAVADIERVLKNHIHKLTGIPLQNLAPNVRLQSDLQMRKESVEILLREICRELGFFSRMDLEVVKDYALVDLVRVLWSVGVSKVEDSAPKPKNNIGHYPRWVRNLRVVFRPEERPTERFQSGRASDSLNGAKALVMVEDPQHPLCQALLRELGGQGCDARAEMFGDMRGQQGSFDKDTSHFFFLATEAAAGTFPERIRTMVDRITQLRRIPYAGNTLQRQKTLVIVQLGDGEFEQGFHSPIAEETSLHAVASALTKERSDLKVRVVSASLHSSVQRLCREVAEETKLQTKYSVVGFDRAMRRYVYGLDLLKGEKQRPLRFDRGEVVIVTGGAKGITAECAVAFGKKFGVQLALLGSSQLDPKSRELERFGDEGVIATYFACDVGDPVAVKKVVDQIQKSMGPVAGIIHGAGRNKPGLFMNVGAESAVSEIGTKVFGMHNLLSAIDPAQLKLAAALTSILGVECVPGNAWYGFSNEVCHNLLRKLSLRAPRCRTISFAYSLWADVGMATRLKSADRFSEAGVAPLSPEEGVGRFLDLLDRELATDEIVITSGIWEGAPLPTPVLGKPDANRFLERIVVAIDDVECLTRTHLTLEDDKYLVDHCYKDNYLFPTVFGLEAMAQAAAYVTGIHTPRTVRFENVQLERPITVPKGKGADIEVHALKLDEPSPGVHRLKCCVRAEISQFKIDHFSAEVILEGDLALSGRAPSTGPALDFDIPRLDKLLFQGPTFKKVKSVFDFSDRMVIFGSEFQNAEGFEAKAYSERVRTPFVLGDPYLRDVLLQGANIIYPKHDGLPVAVGKWEILLTKTPGKRLVHGDAGLFEDRREVLGDVHLYGEDGSPVEKLTQLKMRILRRIDTNPPLVDFVRKAGEPRTPVAPAPRVAEAAPAQQSGPYAVLVADPEKQNNTEHLLRLSLAPEVAIAKWPVLFNECSNFGRGVSYTAISDWLGRMREFVLTARYPEVAKQLMNGEFGWVTNSADFEMTKVPEHGDVIECRYWVKPVSGREKSSVDLFYEWTMHDKHGNKEPFAKSRQRTTWVRTIGHGLVEVEAFPEVLLQAFEPNFANKTEITISGEIDPRVFGEQLWAPKKAFVQLAEKTFQTSQQDSNLIGNIYFSHYFKWQRQVRDALFVRLCPKLVTSAAEGEPLGVFCSSTHLREAMPYDEIVVKMSLRGLYRNGMRLMFEYFKKEGDKQVKLASAFHDLVWSKPGRRPEPMPLPSEVVKEILRIANGADNGS